MEQVAEANDGRRHHATVTCIGLCWRRSGSGSGKRVRAVNIAPRHRA